MIHLANGIQHARKFTGRLLAALRGLSETGWVTISEEARLNIKWFIHYASVGNGISLFGPETDYLYIECDACLSGGGANSHLAYYTWRFSPRHVETHRSIHMLETINLLVSYKILAPTHHHRRLTVVLLTDNMASACALMSGKTKDKVLRACARQMWLEAAIQDQLFIIQHKAGAHIPLVDALSRYQDDPSKATYTDREIAQRGLIQVPSVIDGYTFFSEGL